MPTRNDHGTGCTFAAAVTARLARGAEVGEAVTAAKAFVSRAVVGGASWHLDPGHGPRDHVSWSRQRRP